MIQYKQKGNSISCLNEGAESIIYGTGVIVGNNVYIAASNINPNSKGVVSTEGVFTFNTSVDISAGDTVFYDSSSDNAFKDLSEISSFNNIAVAGIAVGDTAGGKIDVKLVQSVLSPEEIKKIRSQG